jgi:glycosyltransferase involved in cell wall biosynthesis
MQLSELPDLLITVDDCSTDPEVSRLLSSFCNDYPGKIKNYSLIQNHGVKGALKTGFENAIQSGCDLFINLDSDAIVKPNFITRLKELKQQFPDNIVSGFNSRNKRPDGKLRNPIISEHEGYALKAHCNGINMCINRDQYEKIVRPALNTGGNWDFNCTTSQPVVIAVPSLIEHIGFHSSMGHDSEEPDTAWDFERLSLPDVTLFGIDGRDPSGLLKSAEISQKRIDFGAVEIITEKLFEGREGYSKFCIERMTDYVKTSHVLIIHPDSCVLNPDAWDNDWLNYDYIGAPWPFDAHEVGNGGFSLRSKRLLDILKDAAPHFQRFHPEDEVICRLYRKWLEDAHGIKFAPVEVAERFSIEAYGARDRSYSGQFGYHGGNIDFINLPKWQRPYELGGLGKTRYAAVEEYLRKKALRPKRRPF